MRQRKILELYPLTMCCFIKRTRKCTKLFLNLYLDGNNNIYFNSPDGELIRDTFKDIVNIEEYKWAFYKPE